MARSDRIDGYAEALFEVARGRGHARRGRGRAVPLRPLARGQRRAAQRAHRRADPGRRRQAIVEDLLGGKATPTTVAARRRWSSAPAAAATCRRSSTSSSQRAAAPKNTAVAEVRSAVAAHRRPAATASPRRSANATGKKVEVKVDRRPVRARRHRRHGRRHRHRRLRPHPSRPAEDPPLRARRDGERNAWLSSPSTPPTSPPRSRKNLEGFEPSLEATHGRPRRSRSATASPACRGLPDAARQRAARVRGRHASASP